MALSRQKPWTAEHSAPELILTNANVIDVERGEVLRNHHLHLKDGKIISINSLEPSSSTAVTVDVGSKYVCPGLIDCHVHLTATPGESRMRDVWEAHPDTIALRSTWTAKQMLLRGFTSARDTCGATYALREAIAEGLIPGPRLFISGKALSQTGGHGDLRLPHQEASLKCCGGNLPGPARICDGVPACLEAARDELRQGADFLKIMCGGGVGSPSDPLEMVQFTPEEIQAITRSAHLLGKYVTAHAYSADAIRQAVNNGVTCIEHANFVDEPTAKLLAENDVFVVPTLVTYQAILTPEMSGFLPESLRQKCQQIIDGGLVSIKLLQDAGVTLCYGTDLFASMQVLQNQEFVIRKQVQSNLEVLRSATVNAAKLVRMEGKIGTVKEGAFADLLILEENPLEDVACLNQMGKNLCAIIKEGRTVRSRLEGLKIDEMYA